MGFLGGIAELIGTATHVAGNMAKIKALYQAVRTNIRAETGIDIRVIPEPLRTRILETVKQEYFVFGYTDTIEKTLTNRVYMMLRSEGV